MATVTASRLELRQNVGADWPLSSPITGNEIAAVKRLLEQMPGDSITEDDSALWQHVEPTEPTPTRRRRNRRYADSAAWSIDTLQTPEKCPTCHHRVLMPCWACELRSRGIHGSGAVEPAKVVDDGPESFMQIGGEA